MERHYEPGLDNSDWSWNWFRCEGNQARCDLPGELFDKLTGGVAVGSWREYPTAAEAMADLAKAQGRME